MNEANTIFAPAKVNLCLHVTGKRSDGYHLLDSLVVFADVGDQLTLTPASEMSLSVSGPFADGVPNDARNLIWKALESFYPNHPQHIHLEKNLPHPAGLGGGSSDAASAIKAVSQRNGLPLPSTHELAQLGADVPVCLSHEPQHMSGIGEDVESIGSLPDMAILLVNPGIDVPTVEVFSALEQKTNPPVDGLPKESSFVAFVAWLSAQRNDLEPPALKTAPEIQTVLKSLRRTDAALVRMSGSGATCFGLFPTLADAERATEKLKVTGWWVKAAKVKSK